ncbi:MAG: sugar ABC transporter permease [Spirochaetales bacterium]|jgi:putative aldouronate transport system permease protein|nr:sugar ABC transporter permease [Spirochaetales bacterium]
MKGTVRKIPSNNVFTSSPPVIGGNWFKRTWEGLKKTKSLQFMLILPLVYLIIFHYVPMYGILIAFKDYSIRSGIMRSPWIGFDNFRRFIEYPYFGRIIRNTVLLRVYSLVFSFPAPIIFALCINEIGHSGYKRSIQTVSFLPHFLATATVIAMATTFLSPSRGFINIWLNRLFGITPTYFMIMPQWFRTIYISTGIWQNLGWGAIIYLAALSRVEPNLLEASTIDGCSRLRKIWHINLPTIRATVILLLILNIGQLFTVGAEKVLLMYNPATYETADVIQTYVYRRGILKADFSYGTAVGLFNSAANLILLVAANQLAKKYTETSLW